MSRPGDIAGKIIRLPDLITLRKKWMSEHRTVVFTNGCFDILHLGHTDYLTKAASLGDILIVGLNTDDSVRRIKGEGRPLQDEKSRAMILASLQFVDYVILFAEDTPYELIAAAEPDLLVKGSDYKAEDIVGYDIVNARGGRIVTIDFLPGYSTTAILEKMARGKNRY